MKVTDPEILREFYDIEADWKLLIGHRFKTLAPVKDKTSGRGRKARRRIVSHKRPQTPGA
jgi:hypothetical protein